MRVSRIHSIIIGIGFLLIANAQTFAQSNNQVFEVLNVLKNLDEFGYSYKINIHFPDGQKDSISGETYSSHAKGIVYNSSSLNTILYNGTWYFNANHTKKQATVYKMQKRFSPKIADSIAVGVFQFQMYKDWMDSIVTKYGTINGAVLSNNKISYTITFPTMLTIKRIFILFDLKRNIPDKIEVEAVVEEDEDGQAVSTITCTNYTKDFDEHKLNMKSYAEIDPAKSLKLIKYKNYKLITLK